MRPQRVALKHHPGVSLVRRQPRHVLVAKEDLPFFWNVESGHAAQQRRFAAATGSKQEKQLTRLDRQVQFMQRRDGSKSLRQLLDFDGNHAGRGQPRRQDFTPRQVKVIHLSQL